MAKYTIIADVNKAIVNLLRDKLVPEPIDKMESIGICEPKDRGDYVVGIHPYNIREEAGGQQADPQVFADGTVREPPAMIEVNYMISVSSKADLESRSSDEAKIIGKIIQVFNDNAIIPNRYLPNDADSPIEDVPISSLPLEMEEKVKVWTMFGESYKLSVFYVAGPIAIDSEIVHKPRKRVEAVYLNSSQVIPKKIIQFETRIKEEDIDDEYTEHDDEEEEEDEDMDEDGDGEDEEDEEEEEEEFEEIEDEDEEFDDLDDDSESDDYEEFDDDL